ncbi:MAG TPA: hypothetical protein VK830_01185 [Xanthomonadales bacterium]|nr:hypothetical protein [Xanthomonadales bacterium]
MNPAGQRAYLKAMGIPVWVRRGPAQAAGPAQVAGLQLGPGKGPLLLLCAGVSESSSHLAADIARALRCEPIWGWPAPDDEGRGVAEAVGDGLFTHLLVFGSETEAALFGGPAPESLGSARVLRVATLQALAADPDERRGLWRVLVENRLA